MTKARDIPELTYLPVVSNANFLLFLTTVTMAPKRLTVLLTVIDVS